MLVTNVSHLTAGQTIKARGAASTVMFRIVKSLTRSQKRAFFLTLDIILIPLAFLFTLLMHPLPGSAWSMFVANWPIVALLMVTTAGASLLIGVPRIRLNAYETQAILKTLSMTALVTFVAIALDALGGLGLSLGFFVSFGINLFVLIAGSRLVMLQMLTAVYRSNAPVSRVLIYGAGRTGMQLASALRNHPTIQPVAFIDDNAALKGMLVSGLPVYPSIGIEQIAEENVVERVLLAMPSLSQPKRTQIAKRLERMGLEVQSLPSFAQLVGQEALVEKLMPTPVTKLLGRKAQTWNAAAGLEDYQGRTVLITGAGGSIGSELCRQVLACRPKRLVLFELSELALYTADMELRSLAELTDTEVVPVLGSVADDPLVRSTLSAFDVNVVIHAAAYKHVPLVEANPLAGLANNVFGTAVMAQAAREFGVERFVLISSDKAVRPANVMGASKRFAELIVQDLSERPQKTVFSIVRFGNVLGSSGSVIPLFEEQIANGGPVTVTDINVTRYFMTVQEATQLVLRAGSLAEGGEVFVLDMGKPVQVIDLARKMITAAGYTIRDDENQTGDIEIVTTGLRPGEKLHEELMVNKGDQVTAHDKIFRVREEGLSELEVASALKSLKEAVGAGDVIAARALVDRWIGDDLADVARAQN